MLHKGKHVQVYYNHFLLTNRAEVVCELTGMPYADIHHIDAAGMGGRDSVHYIENLMALNRHAHEWFGDKTEYKEWLIKIHLEFMKDGVPYYKKNPADPIFFSFMQKFYKKVRFL